MGVGPFSAVRSMMRGALDLPEGAEDVDAFFATGNGTAAEGVVERLVGRAKRGVLIVFGA
jgi:hypothetical protein